MPDELKTILDFVEGRLDTRRFESALYANVSGYEALLSRDAHLPTQHYAAPSLYQFLIRQDFSDPGDVLSAHAALSDYLERNGITANPVTTYGDFYTLLLEAQPNWLDVNTAYLSTILENAGGRTGEELRQWLRGELLKRFRYLEIPPVWIQSPEWPIIDNEPLFFLGQIEIGRYFHDQAAAYVFHDRRTDHCETVIQVA